MQNIYANQKVYCQNDYVRVRLFKNNNKAPCDLCDFRWLYRQDIFFSQVIKYQRKFSCCVSDSLHRHQKTKIKISGLSVNHMGGLGFTNTVCFTEEHTYQNLIWLPVIYGVHFKSK